MMILVMGVAGAGKTTVGTLLAEHLGWRFLDADDFHSQASIANMRRGLALTDVERIPWLNRLNDVLLELDQRNETSILACSALTERYRLILLDGLRDYRVVYLKTSPSVAIQRLEKRTDHFMPPTLIMSQFELLEEPRGAMVIDGEWPAGKIVQCILSSL
jgi:gluconokinase